MPNRTTAILTKNDYAYAEILERILTGRLEAGAVIPQRELAQQIGVSTTPLREAVRRLAAEGFIHLEAHRDARVTEVSAEEARHLYEVRESMDPLAAGLAAERRTESDLRRIRESLESMTTLRDPADVEALAAHRAFHRSIYEASRNPILIDVLERLWDKADRYRLVGLRFRGDSPSDVDRVTAEHRRIADAVERGDAAGATAAMLEHVRNSLGRRAIDALGAARG
ncbi:GntR family transcriptional regulator [Rothia sp. AR01]|uniref:GntR family transcriptional regulator n=1 Tax=Rothia santali TaxID=2949643 RepID=A0A9X2HIQ7_9MICC|nr:GntR family transcriptional regulator [Rothia santali]MCP3425583.1 GntR family transcriptional regulator [Rothia santali]